MSKLRVKQLKPSSRPLPKAVASRVTPGCGEAFSGWAKGARGFLVEGEFH